MGHEGLALCRAVKDILSSVITFKPRALVPTRETNTRPSDLLAIQLYKLKVTELEQNFPYFSNEVDFSKNSPLADPEGVNKRTIPQT